MYRKQLSDAKTSSLKNIAGACVNSQDFIDVVNEAQRRLAKRGNWFDTEWVIRVCLHDRCVVWPRHVGTVLGVRWSNCCSDGFADMRDRWYSILGNTSTCNWGGDNYVVAMDSQSVPTIRGMDLANNPLGGLLRYYVVKRNDLGKKIRVYGKQYGGQPLQEKDSNGDWIDGITIIAADPYGTHPARVSDITAITREATQGMAYLYEYNDTTTELRDLGAYEPSETNPRYRRTVFRNLGAIPGTTDANGQCNRSVEALIKLEFIPAQNDNDFLMIDDLDALKLMIQAIKAEEGNDEKLAEIKIIKAVRELNFRDRDRRPGQQLVVRAEPVGNSLYNPI